MKVRIGFIGTGRIANRHMEKLSQIKDVALVSVCDVEKKEAERKSVV